MKRIMNKLIRDEKGQTLILVQMLLLVGSLIITPLLGFMSTGLMVGQTFETKMDEFHAADAGVENSIFNIIALDAPNNVDLQQLSVNDTFLSNLTEVVNGEAVSTTATKLSLLVNYLDPDEYKEDQPHEDWVSMAAPIPINQTDEYVEYNPDIVFHYGGTGKRSVETIGVFFCPLPRGEDNIDGPYDIVYTPVLIPNFLANNSPEVVTRTGSFAFLWRWQTNRGPVFDKNNRDGTLNFKFKIWDPRWSHGIYFVWATFKEQDVSYATSAPDTYNWRIQASAGDTTIRAHVIAETDKVVILAWEIDP